MKYDDTSWNGARLRFLSAHLPFFFLPLLPQTVLAEPVETLWLGVGEHKATSQAIFGLDEADLLSILCLQPCRWYRSPLQRLHQCLKLW